MKSISAIIFLAVMASGAPSTEKGALSPFDVKLELHGNSTLRVTITNKDDKTHKILKTGGLLCDTLNEKVRVFSGGMDTL